MEIGRSLDRALDPAVPTAARTAELKKLLTMDRETAFILKGPGNELFLSARDTHAYLGIELYDTDRLGRLLALAAQAVRNHTSRADSPENRLAATALELVAPFAEAQGYPLEPLLTGILDEVKQPTRMGNPLPIAVVHLILLNQFRPKSPRFTRELLRIWKRRLFGGRTRELVPLVSGHLADQLKKENWERIEKRLRKDGDQTELAKVMARREALTKGPSHSQRFLAGTQRCLTCFARLLGLY